MIEGPVRAQLFQQIQLIADGNGGNFGDLSVLFLDKDVGEIDVGAVGQSPCQQVVAGHIDCAAGLTDVHGDGVALKVDHLGDLVPVHVSDLADLSVGKGEAQITEIVAYAVCLSLRSQELQLAVLIAHPEDKLVGQQVEALVVFGIEQVVGKIEVYVLAVMLDGAVGREDIVGIGIVAVFVHILDEGILGDAAGFGVIAAAGLEHIQISVVLKLGHHLARGLNSQFHLTGRGVDLAQGQLGILDFVGPALRVLAVHEHMSEVGPDVAHGLQGDIGVPLRLGSKAVVVGPGDLRDIDMEGSGLCADASGAGDGELVHPELGAVFGVEQTAVHADIHDALCHVLVKNGIAVGGPEDHIAVLFGDDAQAGQLVRILGPDAVEVRAAGAPLQERGQDEADVQIGSGLLAVDQGDLVDIQIPVGAVGDHHIGQEAAVINRDHLVGIGGPHIAFVVARSKRRHNGLEFGKLLVSHIGFHRQRAAVVVVKTVEGNAAVVYAAHLAVFGEALVIQTGVVQLAVFVDIHEAARRRAAKVERAVEDDPALHPQGGAGNGFFTAVIGQAEGKDLDHPLGGGFGLGLGAALHQVHVVNIGGACRDLHVLARHVCHGGDIDLCHDIVTCVAAVDHHVGLGRCRAGSAGDLCGCHGVVIHLGGLGLNIELVDTAEEHIVQADDLLVVHGVDIRVGFCGGAGGNRGGACVGVELLDNVGNHLGFPCVDIGLLCPGVVSAQADVGGDLYGHIRRTVVAARKAFHIPVSVCGGLGGVGGLYQQLAEEGGDLSALRHGNGGAAGLLHRGLGAFAGQDDAAAVHVKVGIHVRLAFVAAEDIQIAVAGSQTGVFADADALAALPGQADACVAVLGKSHVGGIDDAVEIHIGVGHQVDVFYGFRLCVFAHGHGACLAHLHIDQVGAAGDKADTGAVHGGVGFHLVDSLHKQLIAREDSAVQVSRGGLAFHLVGEFVSGNVHRTDARCLVGAGIHLCIAFSIDGHIAAGVDDRPCAHTGQGGIAVNGGLGLNDLAVQAAQGGGGDLRPGNQLVDLSGGAGKGLDADAARIDLRIAVNVSLGGHLFDLGMGKDQAQSRQTGRRTACLRLGGDLHGVGLRQNRHSAGSMDGHIALDEGGVAHLDVGKGPLLCAADQADGGTAVVLVALGAVASQLGGGGGIVHSGADVDKPGGVHGAVAHHIGFLAHVQAGLGLVHADLNTAYRDLFAVHVRIGKAAAAVHLNVQIAGGHIAAALEAAAGRGIGDGRGRVACAADRVQLDAAAGLGGLGRGIGLVPERDADIGSINIGSGAVQICLKAAARSGVHHHDAQFGAVGAELALIVVGKGIALGLGQNIQIAAGFAGFVGAAEAGAGNISLVAGCDLGVCRVAAEICAADVDIGGLQHGLRAFAGAAGGQTGVIEQRGNAGVVICLYAAAGDVGALRGRDRGIDIADQQLAAGNAGMGCGNGRIGGCGAVGGDLNAVVGAVNRPCRGDIAAADGRSVGCSRYRVSQIHLAADKVYADLGLLPGGLSPGGKLASDLQGGGTDGAVGDLRPEAAVGSRLKLDRADIHQAQLDIGHFGAGLGIACGVAYNADRAGGGNSCVADAGAADSGGTGFYRVDSQTGQLHIETAGGGAAQGGGSALTKALVQFAAKGHLGRVKDCAADIGGLLCRQRCGEHIHRHINAGYLHICLGNTGVRQSGTDGLDRHVAGSGNGAAAHDTGLGLGADHSLGQVGLRADGVCIHAAQRLGGFRRSLSGIGVCHLKALNIDHSAGAVDKGTEAACGLGPDDGDAGGHIAGLHIGLLHAGVGDAVGLGLYLQRLAGGKNAGSGHGGFVNGVVLCKGDVAGKAVLGELDRNRLAVFAAYADGRGVRESCLCALAVSVIEEGLNGDCPVIYGNAVQLGLVGGVQQSHCHVRRHIHQAHLKGGGVNNGFRKGGAVCLKLYLTGGDAAAAVDFGEGVGACVADRNIGIDACQIGAYASRAGRQMAKGVCGVARLNGDAVCRKAAALIQPEICLENALGVGIAGHDSRGNYREILIGDL